MSGIFFKRSREKQHNSEAQTGGNWQSIAKLKLVGENGVIMLKFPQQNRFKINFGEAERSRPHSRGGGREQAKGGAGGLSKDRPPPSLVGLSDRGPRGLNLSRLPPGPGPHHLPPVLPRAGTGLQTVPAL